MDFIQLGALRSLREELNDLFVNSGFEIEPLNKLIYRYKRESIYCVL